MVFSRDLLVQLVLLPTYQSVQAALDVQLQSVVPAALHHSCQTAHWLPLTDRMAALHMAVLHMAALHMAVLHMAVASCLVVLKVKAAASLAGQVCRHCSGRLA